MKIAEIAQAVPQRRASKPAERTCIWAMRIASQRAFHDFDSLHCLPIVAHGRAAMPPVLPDDHIRRLLESRVSAGCGLATELNERLNGFQRDHRGRR
jgi:hypothetical protein